MLSSFDPDMFVPLPKAPPLGLYLDYVDYMFYERKHCSLGSSDPVHECLDWAEEEVIFFHVIFRCCCCCFGMEMCGMTITSKCDANLIFFFLFVGKSVRICICI